MNEIIERFANASAANLIAFSSLCVAGIVASITPLVARYQTRNAAEIAREGRREDRRADTYIKVLKSLQEHRNWITKAFADGSFQTEGSPYDPELAARLTAFASVEVQRIYEQWKEEFGEEWDVLRELHTGDNLDKSRESIRKRTEQNRIADELIALIRAELRVDR